MADLFVLVHFVSQSVKIMANCGPTSKDAITSSIVRIMTLPPGAGLQNYHSQSMCTYAVVTAVTFIAQLTLRYGS